MLRPDPTTTASKGWYTLCDLLAHTAASSDVSRSPVTAATCSPRQAPSQSQPLRVPLSVRVRRDTVLDIVMAEVPFLSSTPTAGMKRTRDEDDDGGEADGFGAGGRLEKVWH